MSHGREAALEPSVHHLAPLYLICAPVVEAASNLHVIKNLQQPERMPWSSDVVILKHLLCLG